MTEVVKNLGQIIPAANALTALMSVPPATSVVVSSIVICNQSSELGTFRLSHAVGGLSDQALQYLYYDEPIPGNRTFVITLGITLATGDVLRFSSNNGQISTNVYGAQLS